MQRLTGRAPTPVAAVRLTAYPTPSRDRVTLHSSGPLPAGARVELREAVTGRVVGQQAVGPDGRAEMAVGELAPGLYLSPGAGQRRPGAGHGQSGGGALTFGEDGAGPWREPQRAGPHSESCHAYPLLPAPAAAGAASGPACAGPTPPLGASQPTRDGR